MFTSKSPSGVELMVLHTGVNLCAVCYTRVHSSVVVRRTKAEQRVASSSYMPGREGDPNIGSAFVLRGDSK